MRGSASSFVKYAPPRSRREARDDAWRTGFTTIELLLAVAILAIATAVGGVSARSLLVSNQLAVAQTDVTSALERAQVFAQSGREDGSWGVHAREDTLTLFQGDTYAERNAEHDRQISLPGSVTVSSEQTIIFAELTGLPEGEASITLEDGREDTHTIDVNARGTVTF